MQAALAIVLAWFAVALVVAVCVGRRIIVSLWREPVLKRPVLIIESDDWGAGPLAQAEQLERIAELLARHADCSGRKPVLALGIVLAIAEGARIIAGGLRHYAGQSLDHPQFAPILRAITRGTGDGVFSLQLHGGEHYWPASLLNAARTTPAVAEWLRGTETPRTEALPPALQSRWIDASELPSKPLPEAEIRAAVLAEVTGFRRIFGKAPKVAVPPTFIWSAAVESAWSDSGVQFVVTPGRRYQGRDARGQPIASGPAKVNGEAGAQGVTYMVRDDYFEPVRGHKAEHAIAALAEKTRLGRPTLLETHRANFLADAATADAAIAELERLLDLALKKFPDVRFFSTEELASLMRGHDPELVEGVSFVRLHVWLRRLWVVSGVRKLAWLTGLVVPGWVLYLLTSGRRLSRA